jgi:hypothetical protein
MGLYWPPLKQKWPARSRAQTVLMALKMSSSETLYPIRSHLSQPLSRHEDKNETTFQEPDPNQIEYGRRLSTNYCQYWRDTALP